MLLSKTQGVLLEQRAGAMRKNSPLASRSRSKQVSGQSVCLQILSVGFGVSHFVQRGSRGELLVGDDK